jgi:hypothetical protein
MRSRGVASSHTCHSRLAVPRPCVPLATVKLVWLVNPAAKAGVGALSTTVPLWACKKVRVTRKVEG